ncbi:MAG: efflux RND transporter periplasmic adaptor subunit, partial [Gammaproteobacteria bacterium]
MKWNLKKIIIWLIILFILIGVVIFWLFFHAKKEEQNIALLPSQNGTIIQLSTLSIEKSGIKTAHLNVTTLPQQYQAYGKILLPQLLVDARNRFLTAQSQAQKANASLASSSKEYDRLKKLNLHNDVSIKNLQAAEATWLSDKATANSAENSFKLEMDSIRAQWGSRIADWIMNDSQEYLEIMQLRNYLVQVTLPNSVAITSPPSMALIKYDKQTVSAKFISISPIADELLQGVSFYFILPNINSLLPGMNVTAFLPTTTPISGVRIPLSASIWW